MATPQRRTGKTAKRLRRTHFKLSAPTITKCPHCGEAIRPHTICPKCGYYNGKQVLKVNTKGE